MRELQGGGRSPLGHERDGVLRTMYNQAPPDNRAVPRHLELPAEPRGLSNTRRQMNASVSRLMRAVERRFER